ncbi:hypothetical protein EalM132_00194 [Exiguobacterium phage vB_EalM-132]|nr:hypothetical protein EalM132_00024 [Exiguobacterium phage vB_EalM-132]AYP68706.1 hypothetical protein EalM132_00194 [Exiguobacterium phage vB_EalM-132]
MSDEPKLRDDLEYQLVYGRDGRLIEIAVCLPRDEEGNVLPQQKS